LTVSVGFDVAVKGVHDLDKQRFLQIANSKLSNAAEKAPG
jgi:hypothetical protein